MVEATSTNSNIKQSEIPTKHVYVCTRTQSPPELVEGISMLLVQVDVVPQELDVYLLTVLGQ